MNMRACPHFARVQPQDVGDVVAVGLPKPKKVVYCGGKCCVAQRGQWQGLQLLLGRRHFWDGGSQMRNLLQMWAPRDVGLRVFDLSIAHACTTQDHAGPTLIMYSQANAAHPSRAEEHPMRHSR